MIPQFYGNYLDSSSVNWSKKNQSDKSKFRMEEINEKLPKIWSIIENLLNQHNFPK